MRLKKIKSKSGIVGGCDGYLIDADEKIARGIVASLKDRKFKGVVGVLGRSGGFNRRVVESLKIDYLVSPELGDTPLDTPLDSKHRTGRGTDRTGQGKDSLKQRDSGLNHVVAKEMAKRGVVMVIDFDSIAESPLDTPLDKSQTGREHRTGQVNGKDKALRLARIMQNVKICRRAKCGIRIWGGVDEKALKSFGFGVGMSSVQVRDAVGG